MRTINNLYFYRRAGLLLWLIIVSLHKFHIHMEFHYTRKTCYEFTSQSGKSTRLPTAFLMVNVLPDCSRRRAGMSKQDHHCHHHRPGWGGAFRHRQTLSWESPGEDRLRSLCMYLAFLYWNNATVILMLRKVGRVLLLDARFKASVAGHESFHH